MRGLCGSFVTSVAVTRAIVLSVFAHLRPKLPELARMLVALPERALQVGLNSSKGLYYFLLPFPRFCENSPMWA